MITFSIMTARLKTMVSKKKIRYQANGFDLDLSYILPNLIAMAYPAERLERVYRNDIDDVVQFMETAHKDHYKIYNLCSERNYNHSKFHNRVAQYPIDDHNPPPFELIKKFCEDVDKWLRSEKNNVAAVHCKAGKGRTGVMVCCYLIHIGKCETAEAALNFYAEKRTHDKKGVTIPSQRRYVHYYEKLVKSGNDYKKTPLFLKSIILEPIPNCYKSNCIPSLLVYEGKNLKVNNCSSYRKFDQCIVLDLEPGSWLIGDIKVEIFNGKVETPNGKAKGEKIFTFWFNTYFVKLNKNYTSSCTFPYNTDLLAFQKSSDINSLSASNHCKTSAHSCISSSTIGTSGSISTLKIINGISNNINTNSTSRSSMYEYPSASSSVRINSSNNNGRIRAISGSNLHSANVQDKGSSDDFDGYVLMLIKEEVDKVKDKTNKWLNTEFKVKLHFIKPKNPSNVCSPRRNSLHTLDVGRIGPILKKNQLDEDDTSGLSSLGGEVSRISDSEIVDTESETDDTEEEWRSVKCRYVA